MYQYIHVAAVISAHGFGHAARAAAILERMRIHNDRLRFDIYSEAPEWFFAESLGWGFSYHAIPVDVGVVQCSPFEEDPPKTLEKLEKMYLSATGLPDQLAEEFKRAECRLALCDISPMGILAAQRAGIPSVLVENFTWDWIYEGYFSQEPAFIVPAERLQHIFAAADYHIQAEPICKPLRCDLVSRPVARRQRISRESTRKRLGVPADVKLVLITAGGIEQPYPAVDALAAAPANVQFVIPGGSDDVVRVGNITLLPHHSTFFHPDLVYASDAVMGKLGYSTIAEAYYAGIPFAFAPRDHFRETGPLARFVCNQLGGIEVSYQDFASGNWIKILPELLACTRQERSCPNGADEIAGYIYHSILEQS